MSSVQHVVPPRPIKRRVLRRKKAWFFGRVTAWLAWLCLMLWGAYSFGVTFSLNLSFDWVLVCLCLTVVTGIVALIFRCVEQPREVTVSRFRDWPGGPPVIHVK